MTSPHHAHDPAPRAGAPDPRTPDKELTWLERLYLPEIAKGLVRTFRHMAFEAPFTTQYLGPKGQEKAAWPLRIDGETAPFNPRARGEHILKTDEQGREKCVACLLCEAACPARCIRIVPGPSPWEDRERYPVEFEIDMLRCIYCGYCEEACPCDAIELTPKPYTVRDNREAFLYDKETLKTNYPQDWRERYGGGEGKRSGPSFTGEGGDRSLIR